MASFLIGLALLAAGALAVLAARPASREAHARLDGRSFRQVTYLALCLALLTLGVALLLASLPQV